MYWRSLDGRADTAQQNRPEARQRLCEAGCVVVVKPAKDYFVDCPHPCRRGEGGVLRGDCARRNRVVKVATDQGDESAVDADHSLLKPNGFDEEQPGESATFTECVNEDAEGEVEALDRVWFGGDTRLDAIDEAVDQMGQEGGEDALLVREMKVEGSFRRI